MMNRWIINRKLRSLKDSLQHCGQGVHLDADTRITFAKNIRIGDYVHIQPGCLLAGGGGIDIGEGTIIAHEVQILTQNHNYDSEDLQYLPYDTRQISKKVEIGDYVWIGARATILPGVTIGNGAVIGAGSVVTRDIPEMAVAGGNPAEVLKYRDKTVYDRLLANDAGYIKNCKQAVK